MTEFEISVAGEQAELVASRGQLTYGMAGAQLRFSFDEAWETLTPYALIRQGDAAVAVALEDNVAIIPGHALTAVGAFVYAGVYGVNAAGTVAIPTVWVRLGRLRDGAHIFYDEDTLPTNPIWQTLGKQIGDISRLQTPEKTNLVEAVNSISAGSLGAIPAPETVQVGQLLAVAAADENGRPVQWETAALPAGMKELALLRSFSVAEGERVLSVSLDTCDDGTPLASKGYRKVAVVAKIKGPDGLTTYEKPFIQINGVHPMYGCGGLHQGLSGSMRYSYFTVEAEGARISLKYGVRGYETASAGTGDAWTSGDQISALASVITSVGIYHATYPMEYGTTFQIWGIY